MNFTKNFKWQMVLVAFGACLLFTGRAYSQEIVNTDFETSATSVGSNFNSPASADVNTTDANPQAVYTQAAAMAIRGTNDMDQLSAASLPRESAPFVAIAILAAGCLIVKKVSSNRRNDRNWNSPSPRLKAQTNGKYYVLHG
jgi:hypothetical protein